VSQADIVSARIVEDIRLRERRGIYRNRTDAGEKLGDLLEKARGWRNPVCCPIPSGGIPVGVEVARVLSAPLRLAVVRKVHIPWNPEAGFGAVAWDGQVILNRELLSSLGMSKEEVDRTVAETKENIRQRVARFRPNRPEPDLHKKEVLLVDDGLASGYTMLAAASAIRRCNPMSIVIAVPTAHETSLHRVADAADCIVCPNIRSGPYYAVADAYREWHDVSDEEVHSCLSKAADLGLF
jgi:predicted phosphoribosyltransferase